MTGKHKSIIALVGGKIKAINGTENIDIPIPTEPLTIPPKNTENKITAKVIVSKYSTYQEVGDESIIHAKHGFEMYSIITKIVGATSCLTL